MAIIDRLCAARALKRRIADQRGRLYRVAYSWCGERHLADDLAQEAIARGMYKCYQLQDPARLNSWLYTILNNCWREHLRTQQGRAEVDLDEDMPACAECPEQINLTGELAERVLRMMRELPSGQRQVLSLVALESFSYRQVAEILDIPIGTVMSRLSRARRFLVDRLRAAEAATPPPVYLKRVK